MKKFMSIVLAMMTLMAVMSFPAMAADAGPSEDAGVVEEVETEVEGSEDSPADSGSTETSMYFPFQVILRDADGNELTGTYRCDGEVNDTVKSGDVVYVADGENVAIFGLPEGTQYEVTELDTDGYALVESTDATGTIAYDSVSNARFVNKEVVEMPEMPNSGGPGIKYFVMNGMGLVGLGIMLSAVFGIAVVCRRKNILE